MKINLVAAYFFCLAAGLFLARYELHTDDTGVEVFLILVVTFVLGFWQPGHPWQWALLVGPWAPLADVWALNFSSEKPSLDHTNGLAFVGLVVIVLGMVGSYGGAFLRKGVRLAVGDR